MRFIAFVLCLALGCGSSSRAAAIKSAEIECLKTTLASALQKLSQAAQQGTSSLSNSKTAIAIELTAEELACAAKALAATSSSSEGK